MFRELTYPLLAETSNLNPPIEKLAWPAKDALRKAPQPFRYRAGIGRAGH
jgi:hypothetical protein